MFFGKPEFPDEDLVKGVFSKLASGNLDSKLFEPVKKPIEIVLVVTDTGSIEMDAKVISQICEMANIHTATFLSVTSTLAVFSYGMVEPIGPAGSQRSEFVKNLSKEVGQFVAIVHGKALGWVGLLGSEKHVVNYSFLAPNFREALALVGSIPLGSVREFEFGHSN